jgi:hypothetical protein
VLFDHSQQVSKWCISSFASFDPKSPIDKGWLPNQYKRPLKWSQGGYDSVGLVEIGGRKILRFLQVTVGQTHEVKLQLFSELAQKFQVACETDSTEGSSIYGVEIFIILPRFEGSQFSAKPTVTVTNSGQLAHFSVGKSETKWTFQHEQDQISFLYFDAAATG